MTTQIFSSFFLVYSHSSNCEMSSSWVISFCFSRWKTFFYIFTFSFSFSMLGSFFSIRHRRWSNKRTRESEKESQRLFLIEIFSKQIKKIFHLLIQNHKIHLFLSNSVWFLVFPFVLSSLLTFQYRQSKCRRYSADHFLLKISTRVIKWIWCWCAQSLLCSDDFHNK